MSRKELFKNVALKIVIGASLIFLVVCQTQFLYIKWLYMSSHNGMCAITELDEEKYCEESLLNAFQQIQFYYSKNNSTVESKKRLFRKSEFDPFYVHREKVYLNIKWSHPGVRVKRGTPTEDIELLRPGLNSTLILRILQPSDIVAPDFGIFVDGRERQGLRSGCRSILWSSEGDSPDLNHCVLSGIILTPEGPNGSFTLAPTTFTSNASAIQFMGLINVEGTPFSLQPTSSGGYAHREDSRTYFLQKIQSQEARACGSTLQRPLIAEPPKGDADDFEDEDTTDRGRFEIHARRRLKKNPAKPKRPLGKWVKSSERILELAVFTDAEFYGKMKTKFPRKTLAGTINYVLAMVNNMNILYNEPSLGQENKLAIRLNHLEILTKNPPKLKSSKGQAEPYLEAFCKFAADKNTKTGSWDHAMMLTGQNLRNGGDYNIIGLAWTAAMCDKRDSCSLIEGADFAGSYTMTHELGHSLGMNHDGEETNVFCNSIKYIMAPIEGAGQVLWSTCSKKNLRDFLSGKSDIPYATNPACLKTSFRRRGENRRPIKYKKNKLPGELFSAAEQCAMALGKNMSTPKLSETFFETICYNLKCGNGKDYKKIHPALEGTACGKKKWCQRGKCVSKPK